MRPTILKDIYSRHQLCPVLLAGEKCFRVHRYNEGQFDQVFHEHVPSRRLSRQTESEVLRGLVGRYAGWEGTYILHSHLNNRPGGPSRYPGFVHNVSYPEEGVLRYTVSSGSVSAWSDTVLTAGSFRLPTKIEGG